VAVVALLLAGCTRNAPADVTSPRSLTVTATDSACTVSAATAPAGTLTFAVTNKGGSVTEFYVLGSDGLRIVAEVENIGPGITRDLVISAAPGSYFTACKPGMTGNGIRAAFTVADSGQSVGPNGADADLVAAANAQYASYVRDQVDQLVKATKTFTDAYVAGRDDEARSLYAAAHVHWERIEPVAESFGDLDAKMDTREADLSEGQAWTGWHRLEKDLWPQRAQGYTPLTSAERTTLAEDLVGNTAVLYDRTRSMTFTADTIANGAKSLLDEVATTKVTGEEEYWSRTDLYDFQANVDGARVAWQGLQPLLQRKDAALDTEISTRFAELQKLLDTHTVGTDGFVTYDKLSSADAKALSDAVNALSEPLSKMAAAVLT
jgi:iron uptake system component EfeO